MLPLLPERLRIQLNYQDESRFVEVLKLLGSGQKGSAYLVQDAFGGRYALKLVPRSLYAAYSVSAEISYTQSLGHGFSRVFGSFLPRAIADNIALADYHAILMEYIEGRSLSAFISDDQAIISGSVYLSFAKELCASLRELGANGLCHNDLHSENIIISTPGNQGPILRIIDTGQLKTRSCWTNGEMS